MNRSTHPSALVVGAGIAGLTAAHRLAQAGHEVRVLEAEAHVGGRMSSVERGGFIMNRAALLLPGSYPAISSLAQELGFGELERFDGLIGILRGGAVHRLRSDHLGVDGLRTGLLSWASKLRLSRLVLDAARIAPKLNYQNLGSAAQFDTETAQAYAARRFNPEIWDYIIEPVIRGLSPEASVVEFFNASLNILGTGFLRYPGGIGFLVEALAARLEVHTGARVTQIERAGAGVRVHWTAGSKPESAEVDACVLALPACSVAPLYPELDPRVAELLTKLPYNRALIAHFGLSRPPAEPSMFVLVPKREHPGCYTLTFEHHLRPATVPPGKGQVTAYWDHDWAEARRELDDASLIAQMLPALEGLVPGLGASVELTHIDRWEAGVLRGDPGYCAALAELGERLDPRDAVQLAGDYFTTSTTNGAIVSGERAAARVIERAR